MTTTDTYRNALALGSMLLEYRLDGVLGAGGFGMTYLCTDTHLDKRVAIKEYFPTDLALRTQDGSVVAVNTTADQDYRWGLERFIQEARTLAKFSHPHIVRVNRYFEANATGYMVMDYENGESLHQLLQREPMPGEVRVKQVVIPLLDGLQAVHDSGFLHRDIKPSNIFIRNGGSPVLLDFGAARTAASGSTRSLTAVLTPGYAPLEQYSGQGNQGPWSDIYAMAGVLYRVFTNENPPDAISRLRSDTVPATLAQLRGRVSDPAIRAMDWALALDETQRPPNVEVWKHALQGKTAVHRAFPAAAPAAAMTVDAARAARAPAPDAPTRRTTAPPARRRATPAVSRPSRWRWVGIALVLVVAIAASRSWYRQREEKSLAETASVRTIAAEQATAQATPDTRSVEARAAQLREQALRTDERDAARRAAERAAALRPFEQTRNASAAAPTAPASPKATGEHSAAVPETQKEQSIPAAQRPQAPAYGAAPESPIGDPFERKLHLDFRHMDANRDGYLTADEVRGRGRIEFDFSRLDRNRDGRLTLQEFLALKSFGPSPR